MAEILQFHQVSLTLGKTEIFKDLDMTLRSGERKILMGVSGIGKTSLLRLAAGLIKPNKGTVTRHTDRISFQFQEPRLIPWMTALENVNAVLSDKAETLTKAREYLRLVDLDNARDKLPSELSGGMAQRVALARALAYEGDLYLFDEPFRGLDHALRDEMIALIREKTKNAAVMLVTHDAEVEEQLKDVFQMMTIEKNGSDT